MLPELQSGPQGAATELDLLLKLGPLLLQTEGFSAPQSLRCFARARELALELGQDDLFVMACTGLGASMWAQGRYRDVMQMLQQLAPEGLARLKPMSRLFHRSVLGMVRLHLGELDAAWADTQEALRELETIAPQHRLGMGGIDATVNVLGQGAAICVHQGRLDEADAMTTRIALIAEQGAHEPSRAWALSMLRWRAFRRGEMAESARIGREVLAISERLGFRTRVATGQMMLGRALVANGEVDEGLPLLRAGHAHWLAAGASAMGSEYASHCAEVLTKAGRLEEAAEFLRAGEQVQRDVEERFYEAELLRQRGRLFELGVDIDATGEIGDAEPLYRRALEVARRQGAMLFALRAASDLARLLRAQGRRDEAEAVLAPVYDSFTEGFDYPELVAARALLAQLGT